MKPRRDLTLIVLGLMAWVLIVCRCHAQQSTMTVNPQLGTNIALYGSGVSQNLGLNRMYKLRDTIYRSNNVVRALFFGDQNDFPGQGQFRAQMVGLGLPHEGGLLAGDSDNGALKENFDAKTFRRDVVALGESANIVFCSLGYIYVTNTCNLTYNRQSVGTAISDTNLFCDTFQLYYLMDPNAGTFDVQTNISGGGFSTWFSVNAFQAATTNGFVTNKTVTPGYYSFRIVGTSVSTNRIFCASIYNSAARNYAYGFLPSTGGNSLMTITNCQANVFQRFMTNWQPSLIVMQDTGGGQGDVDAVKNIETWLPYVATNADVIYSGWIDATQPDIDMAVGLRLFAQTNAPRRGFFDVDYLFPAADNYWLTNAGFIGADDIHISNPKGQDYLNQKLFEAIFGANPNTNGNQINIQNNAGPILANGTVSSIGSLSGFQVYGQATATNKYWSMGSPDGASLTFTWPFGAGTVARLYNSQAGAYSWEPQGGNNVDLGLNAGWQNLFLTGSYKGATVTGTDTAGTAVTIVGGASTGAGRGGAVILKTTPSTGSSSTANSPVTRVYLSAKEVTLTKSSATLVFNISLATGKSMGVRLFATTRCDNATDFQSIADTLNFAAVNKAGTVTASAVSTVTSANAVSTGTITDTWTVVVNGAGVDVKCNAVPSLTPGTLVTQWRVEIDSNDTALTVTPQ